MMRGIVLAGGAGSRLNPLTKVVSKQLLPVYDKPLIYYPISTLFLAGIREIAIITKPEDRPIFQQLFGSGDTLGARFEYLEQPRPNGIGEAFLIAEQFINQQDSALVLGDNIFHGAGLGRELANIGKIEGALIFGAFVNDPSQYGVVVHDKDGKPTKIVEKPVEHLSNIAIPGLYFFDSSVSNIAKQIKPSARGELEITSILEHYLHENKLQLKKISRGTAWFDAGSFNGLHDANSYVRLIQDRQNMQIGNLPEIAWRNGWISDGQLLQIAAQEQAQNKQYIERVLQNEF